MELAAKLMEANAGEEAGEASQEQIQAEDPDVVPEVADQTEASAVKDPTPKATSEEPEIDNDLTSNSENSVYLDEDGEIVVDEQHADILEAIEKALEETSKQAINLPPRVYVSVLQAELERIRKERIKLDPTCEGNGGWILDNFPKNNEQLNAMLENNLLPDSFFILQDTSDEFGIVIRRWFNLNRDSIEKKMNKRLSETETK